MLTLSRRGAQPGRLTIAGRTAGQRFSRPLRLRRHEHHPVREAPPSGDILDLYWAYRPPSFAAMARRSRAAVVATVTAVRQGPGIPTGHEHDPPDPDIETQRIALRVQQRWFGRIAPTFELFKTGSERDWGQGDPPYRVGERYIVYIGDRRSDGSYLPVAPDGRLRLRGRLAEPLIAGRVARAVAWLTAEELRTASRLARRGLR